MSLFDDVLRVAELMVPLVVPGAAPAIAAGKAVISMIDTAKATFSEMDQSRLDAIRDDLAAKVKAHAEETAARLRGE